MTKMFHTMVTLTGTLTGNLLTVEGPEAYAGRTITGIHASFDTSKGVAVRAICRENATGIVVLTVTEAKSAAPVAPVAPAAPVVPKVEPKLKTRFELNGHEKALRTIDAMAKLFGQATAIMVGPSGYGKTSLAEALADISDRSFVRINCAVVRDPEEWFGYREARGGSTEFDETEFSAALAKGKTVICLDEVNRLEPWLLNALFPLLDDARATTVHGKRFTVAPDTVFVLTINQGMQYTGTFQLDEAFSNRADIVIKVGPLPMDAEVRVLTAMGADETTGQKIVNVMTALRNKVNIDCSTRASKNVAKLVTCGMSLSDAFAFVITNRIEDQSEAKVAIDVIKTLA